MQYKIQKQLIFNDKKSRIMKAIIKDVICGIVIKTFENVPSNETKENAEKVKTNYCRWRNLDPDKFVIVIQY